MVESNTVTVGEFGNGITVLDQERGSDELGRLVSRDNIVINNKIVYQFPGGGSGAGSDRDTVFENNNIFENNVSLGPNLERRNYWNGSNAPWSTEFKGR